MGGAGKGSFFPSSHVNGPLCIIQVNCNTHLQPSKSLPLVTLPFRSSIVALHLAKPSFLHGDPPCYSYAVLVRYFILYHFFGYYRLYECR